MPESNWISLTLLKLSQYLYKTRTLHIQGVPGGKDKISGVFLMLNYTDITPKHLYPKLNGYGDNGHRNLKL